MASWPIRTPFILSAINWPTTDTTTQLSLFSVDDITFIDYSAWMDGLGRVVQGNIYHQPKKNQSMN